MGQDVATFIESAREDWFGTAAEAVESILVSRVFGGLSEESRDEIRDDLELLLELVTEVHEPRVAIIGDTEDGVVRLVEELLPRGVDGDAELKSAIGQGRWYDWKSTAGVLHLLDSRHDTSYKAFRYDLPDVVLQPLAAKVDPETFDSAVRYFREVDDALLAYGSAAPLVAAILPNQRGADDLLAMRLRDRLRAATEEQSVGLHTVIVRHDGQLAEELAPLLPEGARFPWARLTSASSAQERVADRMIGLTASIAASLAAVPIPIAATLPISTLQILMIAGIAWTSGRERSLKTVAEFLAAAGISIGATYALRELARSLAGLLPVAGPVISAGLAASTTLATGEAAKRYFLR